MASSVKYACCCCGVTLLTAKLLHGVMPVWVASQLLVGRAGALTVWPVLCSMPAVVAECTVLTARLLHGVTRVWVPSVSCSHHI
jgi:hypothetical protein